MTVGLPVRKSNQHTAPQRHRLRLVKAPVRSRRPVKAQVAVARRNFAVFTVGITLLAALGVGRVWLSVQATEASLEAGQLRQDIRSERYEGDMLEVRQSALGSPSRIRAIAGKAMDMAPADSVDYLDLTPKAKKTAKASKASVEAASRPGSARSGLARLLDLTAGEAHVLLVGDVALASSR